MIIFNLNSHAHLYAFILDLNGKITEPLILIMAFEILEKQNRKYISHFGIWTGTIYSGLIARIQIKMN